MPTAIWWDIQVSIRLSKKLSWLSMLVVRDTVEAAKANGYEVIIIADHGNADNAENADGTPNTAHSLNPCLSFM